ncbi:MAG: hypothetical protein QOJ51_405 [Acidobacteriaceae bacterium]|nr:hypothetical protein [Acidobacteriaceae bacterium]MEA2257580.1 hypothetical protein [Acidobacteriaceae bacterium]MEA3005847.1 hypothetical protein [Acidobacteriaceae bacterium]
MATQVMLVMTAAANMPRDFLAEATPVAAGVIPVAAGAIARECSDPTDGPTQNSGPFSASRANVASSQAAM